MTDPADSALHPRHGPHEPTEGTLRREPGSVRRTTSVDMRRPDGADGDLLLYGRARELVTPRDGSPWVRGHASLDMRVAFLNGRKITALTTEPALPALDALIGSPAASGFRARMRKAVPGEHLGRTLLHLLLDDVPGAALVSGYSVGAAGVPNVGERAAYRHTPDLCAGFRQGGTIMLEVGRAGSVPRVTGPVAPPLDDPGDPLAWHPLEPLTPEGMRRRRRLDVWVGADGLLEVRSHFRDSHLDGSGRETVIHEYDVDARVEPGTWRVRAAEATVRVLPWRECPAAAGSAERLVGRSLVHLREEVRRDFRGPSTCTHLNDQLRSLADVPVLAADV